MPVPPNLPTSWAAGNTITAASYDDISRGVNAWGGPVFSAAAYGVVGDNNNVTAGANTTALNNCINAANTAGPSSTVLFDWTGVAYTNGGHLIYSQLLYLGRLYGATLKLANAVPAGTNVMQTASFASLTQTQAGVAAGEYEFMLDRLSVDGNKANNPSGGSGIAIYGYGYWTGVLVIANCHSSGFWTEYYDTGEPINTGVGSKHQRGAHLGKLILTSNDCARVPAVNTRAAQAKGAIGGGQFCHFGPGDSDAEAMEIFRDGAVAGDGFQCQGMDFNSVIQYGGFGFNIGKLVVWLNHNNAVNVGAGIFFCAYLHAEGANTNVLLTGQEWHIASAQIFGPQAGGTNLNIAGGGNFSYIQATMQAVSNGGTMVNIASNTCRDATLLISCAEGNTYNFTASAGALPYLAKICDVSLNNYGTGVVTPGWVPALPPGQTANYKANLQSAGITLGPATGAIYSVTGVPNNAMGKNGDMCLRDDTPGTANQWLYKKAGGVWVGVL